jgi:hypothetical protein
VWLLFIADLIFVNPGLTLCQEIDLLLSSAVASSLLGALPFIFFTNELHVLPPSTLQSGSQPPMIQIAKRFSNSQIEEIQNEFHNAKALGTATAEEWVKGLEERGRERRNDASRWERWERLELPAPNMRSAEAQDGPKPDNTVAVKKEPVVKAEPLSSPNGASPLFRFQPTNPLPQRNFPPFTTSRVSQSTHSSLRK